MIEREESEETMEFFNLSKFEIYKFGKQEGKKAGRLRTNSLLDELEHEIINDIKPFHFNEYVHRRFEDLKNHLEKEPEKEAKE